MHHTYIESFVIYYLTNLTKRPDNMICKSIYEFKKKPSQLYIAGAQVSKEGD
jgi:hypothetical protein